MTTIATSTFVNPSLNSSATATSTATVTAPSDPAIQEEIEMLRTQVIDIIIGPLGQASAIPAWFVLTSLGPDGKWPDSEVDYTTGCPARRANWPAQTHWQRILVMAAAWHGGLQGGENFVGDENLRKKTLLAIDYWFGRDLTNLECMINGGTPSCPCDDPDNTLWNTNWFSNVILIPNLVGSSCILLNETLTAAQLDHCTKITNRSYDLFLRPFNEVNFLTGANVLDVAKIGIDGALLNPNITQITDAYRRIHEEVVIQPAIKADGIRPDGSFGQHGGVLYNGNYGNTNDIVAFEIEAAETRFAANSESRSALALLFEGDHWMIFRNTITGVLHWDFSALGRFISFPVIDAQATGSIKLNLTQIEVLGRLWDQPALVQFAESLSEHDMNANAGQLIGNRMFYNNDYMVHRGPNYVTTVKMYSTRTKYGECLNSQNILGFHLSDGAVYTYLKGNEYEDIAVAWDWNLIPGITTDYEATKLTCSSGVTGIEDFVGGVSNDDTGIAVMRYTNPLTGDLNWQKAWFFLEGDVQHTMISNITSTSDSPVFSVLDQRLHDDAIFMDDGEPFRANDGPTPLSSATLWHGGVGYDLSGLGDDDILHVEVGPKSGNWSAIGTSTEPPSTFDLFAAWIEHGTPASSISYSTFPGTSFTGFMGKQAKLRLQSVVNDGSVGAIYDEEHQTVMVVFWEEDGGSVTIRPPRLAPITISADGNIALIYRFSDAAVYVSDPSQTLTEVQVNLQLGTGWKPPLWGFHRSKDFSIFLPTGGLAGSSVRQPLN
ncbi:hypothetical protein AGABI1DRAFT_31645 [Agaricus bisporus var. burnettii JB137-S8]|uniref:Polysaccharide lyase family 8 protein n=1 Tax=Agaricus bisporus var. burnettii (strain JB137-S8 / ATCC MYA-4627 / FGSC 10392) TaxID=597362 RepID=K5Y6N9_AGABU|nr:uncharacterized protein AGABI1DRAFT_31645 [Agaricus bisporus var. burnettii JB137-S8]EKM83850.1 hypothetical protein AGABI1DRAFT_31645 [Agaricus bisporus var. burnettii JB137-S8]